MKTISLGIVIQGAVSSSFNTSLKKTNFGLLGIDESIKRMSKTKFEMKQFQSLGKDASKNKDQLNILSRSLKKAGIDTRNLDKDSKLLRLSLVNLKKASKVDIKIQGAKEQSSQQKASILGIGAALYGLKKVSNVVSDVLKSQGEIASLEISKKGIDDITKAGHEMSLQFGQITAPQFIKASYDIKSGIASLSEEGVRDFTKMAATTAVATKASINDMTQLYALGYGIFRQDFSSDMDFGKKFSGAIATAVQVFRTDGADLAAGLSNIGASAKTMGISLEEELAVIGLSKSGFASASEAGSAYKAFLGGVGKAQDELGLKFIDANGKMLPMVDILEKIKNKYGDLNQAEIDKISTALGGREAFQVVATLIPKIDELKTAQEGLSKAMEGGMAKAEKMALAMDSGYGWEKMSNAVSYASFTFGKVLTPAVNFAANTLGAFAKGLAWVDEKVSWLIPVLSGFVFGIVALVTVVKIATLTKLGFSLAVNTLKKALFLNMAQSYMSATSFNVLSFSTVAATIKTKALGIWTLALSAKQKIATIANAIYNRSLLTSGIVLGSVGAKIKAFSLWTAAATVKQWLFNIALNANPIGLIIIGIAGLIGLGVILYNKFEPIRNLFNSIYEGGKKFLSFVGFGDDEEESETSKINKPSKKLVTTELGTKKNKPFGKLAATALATTALAANPITSGEVKPQAAVTQNNAYTLKVDASNANSNVDVTKAVEEAIENVEKRKRNRSFGDS